MFPNERAAEIAVQKVRDYRTETNSSIEVMRDFKSSGFVEVYT